MALEKEVHFSSNGTYLSGMPFWCDGKNAIWNSVSESLLSHVKEYNQLKPEKMKKDEVTFAVSAKSFALYQAFKTECEELGWIYNEIFNPFREDYDVNCFFFSSDWHGEAQFALSNAEIMFRLESQFGEALEYAKKVIEDSKVEELTYKDVAKHLFNDKNIYTTSDRGSISHLHGVFGANYIPDPNNATTSHQLEKLLAINKLMNVATYLNPENEHGEYCLAVRRDVIVTTCGSEYGQQMFRTSKEAERAVLILGADVVKLALS